MYELCSMLLSKPGVYRACLLLEPGEESPAEFEDFHRKDKYGFYPLSVSALSSFDRKSGIVVSLGAKAWIEVVEDQVPIWHSLYQITNIKSDLQNLIFDFYTWLENQFQPKDFSVPFEVCCIGIPFDEEVVTLFSELLSTTVPSPTSLLAEEKIKFSIISTVEERILAPLLGAFLNPNR